MNASDRTNLPDLDAEAASAAGWPASTRPAALADVQRPVVGAAFDVCHGALALRALLLVNAAVLLAVGVGAEHWAQALERLGPAVAVALTGTLAWLAAVCTLRRVFDRASATARLVLAMLLGAVIAPLACLPMVALQLIEPTGPRWLAWPLAGAAFALPLALWLQWRARSRLPADATARLAELQSRIRPHFLFNTLNTAVALVRTDPARAEGVLEDLAELFRVALADSGSAVTLADEIELARRYLAIEQLRFGDRLRISWELDPAADRARLPPLLLQPLVENAVRHGVEPSRGGGAIRVRTRARLGQAEITIDNTLAAGALGVPGHGLALANVRERLRLLHDLDAQFEVQQDGERYRVRISVPLAGGIAP